MTIKAAPALLALLTLSLAFGGCSALSSLNPLKEKEKLLPGDRQPALTQAVTDVTGGTPAIGGTTSLAEWSQPGGNAANAPGNISIDGTSGSSTWRVQAVGKADKRSVRPSVPPLIIGNNIYVYDTTGTVTALA